MTADNAALRALDERLDKLRAASDELKDTTREAHAAIKELKRVGKEVRDLLALEPSRAVTDVLEHAVKVGLEGYAEQIKTATDAATDAVNRRYDDLVGILLGYDRRDETDTLGMAIAKRAELVGDCRRCTGTAVVRRYAIEAAALDGDEVPPDGRRFVMLERYLCQRHPDHYGTVLVGPLEEDRIEVELGEIEARRHGATLERDVAEVTAALTTDTEET